MTDPTAALCAICQQPVVMTQQQRGRHTKGHDIFHPGACREEGNRARNRRNEARYRRNTAWVYPVATGDDESAAVESVACACAACLAHATTRRCTCSPEQTAHGVCLAYHRQTRRQRESVALLLDTEAREADRGKLQAAREAVETARQAREATPYRSRAWYQAHAVFANTQKRLRYAKQRWALWEQHESQEEPTG